MDKFFTFGKVSSREYGVFISGTGTFNKPERRVKKFTVPGRNGDLTIDEGAFNNLTIVLSFDILVFPCWEGRMLLSGKIEYSHK